MRKLIACLAVCLLASVNAFADTSYGNQRLDHALYPLHPPKLVVAGEIKVIKGKQYTHDRELSFEVERVILGDRALAHTIITVPTPGFDWPEELVPLVPGSYCILILEKKFLWATAPATKGSVRVATNQVEAIQILEEELLNVLQSEMSAERRWAIILQLAPILRRENASPLISLSKAEDQWVRRAALAALIYATEDNAYIRLAAAEIKNLFADKAVTNCLKQKGSALAGEPAGKFMKNYFFLNIRSGRWGSRWNKEEGAKHLRIWKATLCTGVLSHESSKFFGGKMKPQCIRGTPPNNSESACLSSRTCRMKQLSLAAVSAALCG